MSAYSARRLVNRGDAMANGTQLVVAAPSGGARWFDCYRGTELTARVAVDTDGGAATASLSFPLGGGGYGCALQTGREAPDGALSAFLADPIGRRWIDTRSPACVLLAHE